MKNLSLAALLILIGLVVGCAAAPSAPGGVAGASPSKRDPEAWPKGREYWVDRERSQLRLIVYPEGPMARLGHPHVIGGDVIDGRIVLAEPFEASALRLAIDVAALAVDRPDWRASEGFDPEVDAGAIESTRRNMLSSDVLDADDHPMIRIESIGISGPKWQPDIRSNVSIAGTRRELAVPASLIIDDRRLTATGRFLIRQTDFGLEPFSTAGGALRVADEVLIRFRIVAFESSAGGD